LGEAKREAIAAAVAAGADARSVEIIDVQEMPMTHMRGRLGPDPNSRRRTLGVPCIGDFALISFTGPADIKDIARGAVLLGTGGGGDPYIGELFLQAQLEKGRAPHVIPVDQVADDTLVITIAGVGSPPVMLENLVSDITLLQILARMESHLGKKVGALISAEIGGVNSMFPLALSAITGLPVLDADGVGRAVPRNGNVHLQYLRLFSDSRRRDRRARKHDRDGDHQRCHRRDGSAGSHGGSGCPCVRRLFTR